MGGFNMRKHLGFSTGFNSGRLGALVAKICRYFTTLDGTADYYNVPQIAFSGDFEIEFNYSATSPLGAILGHSTNIDFIYFVDVNTVRFDINSIITDFTLSTPMDDGKLRNYKFVRISGNIECFQDGVSCGVLANGGDFEFDDIGRWTSVYSTGVISDVKITDGTDLIRYYKLDEDLSATSTIIDSGSDGSNGTAVSITSSELFTLVGNDWEGSELAVNGDFATDLSGWTIANNDATHRVTWNSGAARFESDTTAPILEFISDTPMNIGFRYIAKAKATYTSGALYMGDFGIVTELIEGDNEFIYNPTTVKFEFFRKTTNVDVLIDNVSCKRILEAP